MGHCWFLYSKGLNQNQNRTTARGLPASLGSFSWTPMRASPKLVRNLRCTRGCCFPETSSWAGLWNTPSLWIPSPRLAFGDSLGCHSLRWLPRSDADTHRELLKHFVVGRSSREGCGFPSYQCTYSFVRAPTASFCVCYGSEERISFWLCIWEAEGELLPYCVLCCVTFV